VHREHHGLHALSGPLSATWGLRQPSMGISSHFDHTLTLHAVPMPAQLLRVDTVVAFPVRTLGLHANQPSLELPMALRATLFGLHVAMQWLFGVVHSAPTGLYFFPDPWRL
jgi:hypothetical protein